MSTSQINLLQNNIVFLAIRYSGAEPPYPSELTPFLSGIRVAQSLIPCVVFWVLFLLGIVISYILEFTASGYPFDILKH